MRLKKFIIKLIPIKSLRKKLKQKYRANENLINIIKEQSEVANYLNNNYIVPYINNEISKVSIKPKFKFDTDKIIWQYWGQGINNTTPTIVNLCIDSVKKYKGEYKHIILTDDNIKDYIDIPNFIYDKLKNNSSFKYAFFADLLRVYLLSAYGGIWIDATILLTNKIDDYLLNKDFFMFQRAENKTEYSDILEARNPNYFSWDKNFKVRLLNSFIISKKNNEIINTIKDILTEYWKKEDKFHHYFVFQILFNELMQIDKYKNLNCEIIDDTIPHILQINLDKEFNKTLLDDIYKKSNIHKLTYCYIWPRSILEHFLFEIKKPYDIEPIDKNEDITFCTMCFNLGKNKISKIKNSKRDFNDFYLQSLKKLITRYKNIVLWCDEETNDFLNKEGFSYVPKKVINLNNLPHFENKEKYIKILNKMKKNSFNEGYLLKDLNPEDVIDYLLLVHSKIEIIKWAKDNNFYNTNYFYWIDAGTNNEIYTRFWENWDGKITARPNGFKCVFMTNFKKIYKSFIKLSSYEDIALIKAPFEISASMFMINKQIIDDFYNKYIYAFKFLENKNLFTTEQSIFSTMIKLGYDKMFEFTKTYNYLDVMHFVSQKEYMHKIKDDKFRFIIKYIIMNFVRLFTTKKIFNKFKQKYIYK